VLAAGAADADDQLILAFQYVIGNEEIQHVHELVQEDMGDLVVHNEILNLLIVSRLVFESVHIVGIRQKTNIKNQVTVVGNPVFETERQNSDHQILEVLFFHQDLFQGLLKFPREQLTGIQNIGGVLL